MPEDVVYGPGRYAYQEIKVLGSATRTTSGQSTTVLLLPEVTTIKFLMDITAASGTAPTLDVAIEEMWGFGDGSTVWKSLGSFSQKTGTGNDIFQVPVTNIFTRRIRANYGIGGGTPSFTFKLDMIGRSS